MRIRPKEKILPNGTKDEINVIEGKVTWRNGKATNLHTKSYVKYAAINEIDTITFYANSGITNQAFQSGEDADGRCYFLIGDLYFSRTNVWGEDKEGVWLRDNGRFYIRVKKSRLPSQDEAGFNTWIQGFTSSTLIYQLATPKTFMSDWLW